MAEIAHSNRGPLELRGQSTRGVVPVADRSSVFARYQRREGLIVNLGAGLVFGTAIGTAALSTLVLGPLWGLGLLGVGFTTVGWMANAWGLFGNEGLAERLAAELDVRGEDWSFVGLCRADQNQLSAKLVPPRVETDENVGFLRLDDEGLTVRVEGTEIHIERARVRDVRVEDVVEAPMLQWIRIELYDREDNLDAFLLMAREGETLTEQRDANLRLYERILQWHLIDKLKPLVDAGELPAQVI